jgi:1,4-dihydroxy-6-naphthoate synthase
MEQIWNPEVETMEGAAFFQGCLIENVPFRALRAISNRVEPRNREAWKLKEAVEAVQKELLVSLATVGNGRSTMKLTLGFSTCPNDTFMFDALVNGRINTNGLDFEVTMADILHLNHAAIAGKLDIVKVSYNTYGLIRDDYALLNAGSAMGLGCGPLLIAREAVSIAELVAGNARIAIPGKNTTANLLLSYFESGLQNRQEMLFHEVMPAVKSGAADAGLIIHENRFTYQDEGLVCLQDLGAYWEAKTGLPIPLGAICVRRSLGEELIARIDALLHDSIAYAFEHPETSMPFVRAHAQELSESVMQQHIQLYVNDFSLDMGLEGKAAVNALLAVGEGMGLYK